MRRFRHLLLGMVLAAAMAVPAHALTLQGNTLFTSANEMVIVTFISEEAAFSDLLFESSPNEMFLFDSNTAVAGQQVNLGSFNAGLELIFRLDTYFRDLQVAKADGFLASWFSGSGSRNQDGTEHALITFLGNNTYQIGWEDLDFNSPTYDGDFDDMVITVRGVPFDPVIPEPATLALVGIGLASIGVASRRRNRS